jgi:dipeptidyl aminopeptidase/acylaminoacyl peptidase
VVYDTLSKVPPGGGDSAGNTPANFRVPWDPWKNFDTTPYEVSVYDDVRFPSRQAGVTLAAWYVPGDPAAPVVLITHGFKGGKGDGNILPVTGMLHRHGFNVLLYDMSEHGSSTADDGRAAIGNEEYLDLLGAWDWLQTEKHFPPKRIGVFGVSLGAGTTLIAFGQEPQLTAAFVDSPFADLSEIMSEELARNNYPTWLEPGAILMARVVGGDDLLAHSPQDAIRNDAGRPIYIVHGTADERINVHHTQQLAALAKQTGANVTVWMPEGVKHVSAEFVFPAEYEQRVVAFFTAALGK